MPTSHEAETFLFWEVSISTFISMSKSILYKFSARATARAVNFAAAEKRLAALHLSHLHSSQPMADPTGGGLFMPALAMAFAKGLARALDGTSGRNGRPQHRTTCEGGRESSVLRHEAGESMIDEEVESRMQRLRLLPVVKLGQTVA